MLKRTLMVLAMALPVLPMLSAVQPPDAPPTVIDLMTGDGVAAFNARWRYSDVRIVEAPAKETDQTAPIAYTIEPRAGEAGFNDESWPVVAPESLGERRAAGKVCFNWYRINLTVPERVGDLDTSGAKMVFTVTVDDYAEVWVNGQLPRALKQPNPNLVTGFNTPNRIVLSESAKPGEKIQIAIFGMNGPISAAPDNFIFIREAKVEFGP